MALELGSGLGRFIGTKAAPHYPWLLNAAHLGGIHLQGESLHRIQDVTALLNSSDSPHLALFFNHITFEDPAFAISVFRQHILPGLDVYRRPFIPASKWNMDPARNPTFASAAGLAERFLDCEIFPLIQPYMLSDVAKYGFTRKDALDNFREFVRRLNQIAKDGNPRAILLAPEGTRSHDGNLQIAEPGIHTIVEKLHHDRPVCMVGMSISGHELNRGLNPLKPIDLSLTDPWLLNPGDSVPDAHYMMSRIADIHPPDKLGPYNPAVMGTIYQRPN